MKERNSILTIIVIIFAVIRLGLYLNKRIENTNRNASANQQLYHPINQGNIKQKVSRFLSSSAWTEDAQPNDGSMSFSILKFSGENSGERLLHIRDENGEWCKFHQHFKWDISSYSFVRTSYIPINLVVFGIPEPLNCKNMIYPDTYGNTKLTVFLPSISKKMSLKDFRKVSQKEEKSPYLYIAEKNIKTGTRNKQVIKNLNLNFYSSEYAKEKGMTLSFDIATYNWLNLNLIDKKGEIVSFFIGQVIFDNDGYYVKFNDWGEGQEIYGKFKNIRYQNQDNEIVMGTIELNGTNHSFSVQ